jgi:RNA 2',3'-cyclic 3'-phosphodiesterase
MLRLFVALDPPESARLSLARLCNGVPGAKWVPPEQFHLTLRFIGEVDESTFADISDALATISVAPFSLRLRGVGHFPPRGAPRVLWAGVDDGAPTMRLHTKIETRLQRLGLAPDSRKFAPHVTLARLKNAHLGKVRNFLAQHALFASETFVVPEFHLYSSRLGASDAVHHVEATYPLVADV